jgi:hypothetical protein
MSKQVRDSAGHLWPEIVGRLGTNTNITTSDVSQQSHAAGTGVTLMRIANGSNAGYHCHFEVGGNPTASELSPIIPANTVVYITVSAGDKVAIVAEQNHTMRVSMTDILPS